MLHNSLLWECESSVILFLWSAEQQQVKKIKTKWKPKSLAPAQLSFASLPFKIANAEDSFSLLKGDKWGIRQGLLLACWLLCCQVFKKIVGMHLVNNSSITSFSWQVSLFFFFSFSWAACWFESHSKSVESKDSLKFKSWVC